MKIVKVLLAEHTNAGHVQNILVRIAMNPKMVVTTSFTYVMKIKNINAQKSSLILVVKSSSKQKAVLMSVKSIILVENGWSGVLVPIGCLKKILAPHWK